MRLRDLLETVIQQCHVYPERVDWPVNIGIVEHGGFQEYTTLTSIVADKGLQVFWVTAAPESEA